MGPPAPRPCQSCPYRRDVPSGVWSADEYSKLRQYDGDTWAQSPNLFQCHQLDAANPAARMCAGWVGCHGGIELLALRLAVRRGHITPETYAAAVDYESPVPLWESGAAAAEHGIAEIENPSPSACRAVEKIVRRRTDIRSGSDEPSTDLRES